MRQGVDISEVETATKIRAKYLRALENDEFAMLPGGTYVKSFLRTYAEYLGLDAQLLVEEFRAHHEPRVEGELQTLAPPPQQRPGHNRGRRRKIELAGQLLRVSETRAFQRGPEGDANRQRQQDVAHRHVRFNTGATA